MLPGPRNDNDANDNDANILQGDSFSDVPSEDFLSFPFPTGTGDVTGVPAEPVPGFVDSFAGRDEANSSANEQSSMFLGNDPIAILQKAEEEIRAAEAAGPAASAAPAGPAAQQWTRVRASPGVSSSATTPSPPSGGGNGAAGVVGGAAAQQVQLSSNKGRSSAKKPPRSKKTSPGEPDSKQTSLLKKPRLEDQQLEYQSRVVEVEQEPNNIFTSQISPIDNAAGCSPISPDEMERDGDPLEPGIRILGNNQSYPQSYPPYDVPGARGPKIGGGLDRDADLVDLRLFREGEHEEDPQYNYPLPHKNLDGEGDRADPRRPLDLDQQQEEPVLEFPKQQLCSCSMLCPSSCVGRELVGTVVYARVCRGREDWDLCHNEARCDLSQRAMRRGNVNEQRVRQRTTQRVRQCERVAGECQRTTQRGSPP